MPSPDDNVKMLEDAIKRIEAHVLEKTATFKIDCKVATYKEIHAEACRTSSLDFDVEVLEWPALFITLGRFANGHAVTRRELLAFIMEEFDLAPFFSKNFPPMPDRSTEALNKAFLKRLTQERTGKGKLARRIVSDCKLSKKIASDVPASLIEKIQTRQLQQDLSHESRRGDRHDILINCLMAEPLNAGASQRAFDIMEGRQAQPAFSLVDARLPPDARRRADAELRPKCQMPSAATTIDKIWTSPESMADLPPEDHVPECALDTQTFMRAVGASSTRQSQLPGCFAELRRIGVRAARESRWDILRSVIALSTGADVDHDKQVVNLLLECSEQAPLEILSAGLDLSRKVGAARAEAAFVGLLLRPAEVTFQPGMRVKIFGHPQQAVADAIGNVFEVVWCRIKHAGLRGPRGDFEIDTKYLRRFAVVAT